MQTNKFYFIIISILFFNPLYAQTPISGNLSGVLEHDTYLVEGTISVTSSLEIEPGCVFYFNEGTEFNVRGTLYAVGTVTDSIYFLPAESAEHWEGILVDNSVGTGYVYIKYWVVEGSQDVGIDVTYMSSLYIEHTRISHCSAGGSNYCAGGLTWNNIVIPGQLYFNYLELSYNDDGAIFNSWDIEIDSCTFTNNIGPIFNNSGTCDYIVRNSKFINNHNNDGSSIIRIGTADFYNCLFYRNTSNQDTRVLFLQNHKLVNCVLAENGDENTYSLMDESNADSVINTVFYSNYSEEYFYFHYEFSHEPDEFFNNIFYGNTAPIWGPETTNNLILDRENANGDSCDYHYNMILDPLFIDPDNLDFHVLSTSPCIDAGYPEYYDPDGTVSDIGLYYYPQSVVDDPYSRNIPSEFTMLPAYPNPFNGSINVPFLLNHPENLLIQVFNINGQLILERKSGYLSAGNNLINLDLNRQGSGTYLLRMKSNTTAKTQRITLIK